MIGAAATRVCQRWWCHAAQSWFTKTLSMVCSLSPSSRRLSTSTRHTPGRKSESGASEWAKSRQVHMYTCTEYMCTVHVHVCVHVYMYMCSCSFLLCTLNIIHVSVMYCSTVNYFVTARRGCMVYIRRQYTRLGVEVRVSDQEARLAAAGSSL